MEYKDAAAILNCNSGVFDIITPHGKERKRLFLSEQGNICEFAKRSKTKGFQLGRHIIEGWIALKKVESSKTDIVAKFKRYASRATFPSAFVRKCHEADPAKSCYENRITTGTRIDGEIISLKAIERYAPMRCRSSEKHSKKDAIIIHIGLTSGDMTARCGLKSWKRMTAITRQVTLWQASARNTGDAATDTTIR